MTDNENLILTNISTDIYVGKGAGKKILEDFSTTKKELSIISPYIFPKTLKNILENIDSNIALNIVTSEENRYTGTLVRQFLKKEKGKKYKYYLISNMVFIMLISFLSIFCALLKFQEIVAQTYFIGNPIHILIIILVLIILWIWNYKYFKYKKYEFKWKDNVNIKIFKYESNLKDTNIYKYLNLHTKLFIIDSRILYLGSVNFTDYGFKHNYESRVRVIDEKAIYDAKELVNNLLKNDEKYYEVNLELLAKKYLE
ncbi:MAG: phospholipase D-like domain-containing protein [Cetobacterium sp.]